MLTNGPYSDTINNTLNWFKEAVPSPDAKSFNVQLGVHMEEFGEMLTELFPETEHGAKLLRAAQDAVEALAEHTKNGGQVFSVRPDNRINFLDSIVDQLVTAVGTAYQLDMEAVSALNAVNVSNYSKFVRGKAVFNENGKIAKGPNYQKVDLSPFV